MNKLSLIAFLLLSVPGFCQNIDLWRDWLMTTGDKDTWSGLIKEDSNWKKIEEAGLFESRGFHGKFKNFGWARKKVFIPSSLKANAEKAGFFYLSLGVINDADETFFNGRLVGRTGSMPPQANDVNRGPRLYKIDSKEILWDKENLVAVRIFSNFRNGGLAGGKYEVIIPSDSIFHASGNTIKDYSLAPNTKSYEAAAHVDATVKNAAVKSGGFTVTLGLPATTSVFYNRKFIGSTSVAGNHSFYVPVSFISADNKDVITVYMNKNEPLESILFSTPVIEAADPYTFKYMQALNFSIRKGSFDRNSPVTVSVQVFNSTNKNFDGKLSLQLTTDIGKIDQELSQNIHLHQFETKEFRFTLKSDFSGIYEINYILQDNGTGHTLTGTLQKGEKASFASGDKYDWLSTARIFLLDAYYPPFAPRLEFDAEKIARTMQEMHVNVIRMSTMGKYATIQGIRYSTHPDQGNRDLLAEMIAACKPRGMKVIPYISTGHKLAWSTVTKNYPDYAQRTKPGGGPACDHMYVGEDMGTICWNTSYRQAYLDYVTHVVRDYDVSGMYFDTWRPFYFWPGKMLCYCDGCRNGFRKATGLEIPWHENDSAYTEEELKTIDKYHAWYHEELIGILNKVRGIVKSYKDIPLIYNIDNPNKISHEDPRIIASMDAFLYERSESILQRAEGVSLARTLGIKVIPYVGGYDNWPRIVNNQYDVQQQIFTTLMFGGTPIISQSYPYVNQKENREFVTYPFSIIAKNDKLFSSSKNDPYVAVIYGSYDPPGHAKTGWWWKADARTATLGAFAACLYGHIQVTSAMTSLLDKPEQLAEYKVIYLADNVHLTEQQVNNIKQFVANGGGLVASYSTSLYDNNGERNKSFGLEELLKVRPIPLPEQLNTYQAMIGGPNDLYLAAEKNSGLDEKWNNTLAPTWFYEPVEAMEEGKVIMNIVTGDDKRVMLPGVVLSAYGKGKVLYSSCSLESLYQGNGDLMLKELIANFIKLVAPQPPAYTVSAPSALIANMTRSDSAYVLHLTNWTGNKYEKNHLMEDYIAPVQNVRININLPGNQVVSSVRSLTGSVIGTKKKGNGTELILPVVKAYEGILINTREKIAPKSVRLNMHIIEGNSKTETPAMVCITGEDNKVRVPPFGEIPDTPSETKVFYSGIEFKKDNNWVGPVRKTSGLGNNENRSYVYDVLPSIPYWREPVMYQTSGNFSIHLPPGKWRISIEHGNEYIPVKQEFTITAKDNNATKTFTLKRWIDLPKKGWYSGDVHVHHPTNKPQFKDFLLEYAKAEDIHLVNVLEMGHHLGTDFKQEGFGEKFRMCRNNICLVSGQEDPRSIFGHIIGLNLNQMVRDTSVYNYYDLVFKKLHLQPGALVGYAHFSWNGCDLPRGFPWYVTTKQIDFVELLQFAHINTFDYYDYLNLGFRMTAAAGSDVPWGSTLGEVRTFVYTGNKFSADDWFNGLKAGHSFVSNGPALFFQADGQLPGSEISKSNGSSVQLNVTAISNKGIGKIERVALYNNDGLVTEEKNTGNADSLQISIGHKLTKSQWIAAVVYCENSAVAHTTPVYMIIDRHPTWDADQGPDIIQKQLDAIAKTEKEEKGRSKVDEGIIDRMEKAKEFYNNLLADMKAK